MTNIAKPKQTGHCNLLKTKSVGKSVILGIKTSSPLRIVASKFYFGPLHCSKFKRSKFLSSIMGSVGKNAVSVVAGGSDNCC